MDKTRFGWMAFQCLIFFCITKGRATKIEYSMGDMRSVNGESLQYETYKVSSDTTIAVVGRVKVSSAYHCLTSFLPQNKIDLYLEKLVYEKIFPLIRLLSIVRWQIRNETKQYNHFIVWPENGFFSDLQRTWPDGEISLVANKPFIDFSRVRPFVKKLYGLGQDIFASVLPERLRPPSSKEPSIAIHYAEGIDLKRRSDLFWYPASCINPERVIVYADRSYNHPITKEHIKQIESMGMRWVSLCWRRDIPRGIKFVWRAPLKKGQFLTALKKIKVHSKRDLDGTGKWLFKIGTHLLKEVEYWKAFYQMFNIKVHSDAVETGLQNIAQNIALGLVGGVRVGKQRSELFIPISDMIGYHPDHVFFSWNCRTPKFLQGDRNRNDNYVISGFPYETVFNKGRNNNQHQTLKRIKREGGQFFITLYDNMFGSNLYYSKAMMLSFYRKFLEWMLEDGEIGLIIKSKKPQVLSALPEVHELLTCAKNTGRCIQLDDIYGRLASDAAKGINVAVGIGISSAVTEVVISGCRGVHCDLTGLHSHLFYQWGYEKIIFDDIDKLIMALKRYKENPENEPGLGDWSPYIDKLDPFRDGRGGERMGTYMRWLLESFDKGKNRDEAIHYANKLYAEQWGEDKVIEMTN